MAKFASTPVLPHAPITSVLEETLFTHNGAQGFARGPKSELFLLAVANMVGEDTFYEKADARDQRFSGLVQQVAQLDPDFIERMIPWLRNTANMRSASIVAAAEYCAAGGPNKRKVVDSAMSRADEPAEFVAYWRKFHKRALSGGIQRGLQDAVRRLYNERSALRYNSHEHAMRMADVLELTHAKPKGEWQSYLFKYLLDERHHQVATANGALVEPTSGLPLLASYHRLMAIPVTERREHLAEAVLVLSWEQLSGWLQGPMDKQAWEAVIPQMGYMALLRNLRNFDDAKVSDEVAEQVAKKLSSFDEVARSRQFPIRFFSAWNATSSMRWGPALEAALELSLRNVPQLPGRTLVMIDTSGSMVEKSHWGGYPNYSRSDVAPWQHAAVFGTALAQRAVQADLYTYGTETFRVQPGASILRTVEAIKNAPTMRQGTQTFQMLQKLYEPGKHNRIILLTDEQCDPHDAVSASVPMYTWNFQGYKAGHDRSGSDNRYTFGGVTDAAFSLLPLLENRNQGQWPF